MRTEAEYILDVVSDESRELSGSRESARPARLTRSKNYFRIRPTLQDAGLSEALYRVGALAANDLRRQDPDAEAVEVGCSEESDAAGETSDVPAVSRL